MELGGNFFGAISVGVEALDTNCHEHGYLEKRNEGNRLEFQGSWGRITEEHEKNSSGIGEFLTVCYSIAFTVTTQAAL